MALSISELELLLEDTESDLVERKESLSDKDKICQAICAFANDLPNHCRPGVIFVGADDIECPSGLAITDQLLQTLSAIRSDGNILPLPAMTVRKVPLRGVEVAVVEVAPSSSPPVRYRGRIWIRVGPRRAVASADEERRLAEKRRTHDLPFDARPVSEASLDDLDLNLFVRTYLPTALPADVLAENERSVEQRLTALRFLTADGIPTVAGVLVLGLKPTWFVPGAYVQFLRIDGTKLTDPIKDQKRWDGPLPDVLRQLDELLALHISTAIDIVSGPLERQTPDYPLAALQQIVRNALMHRSYEHTNAPTRVTWYRDRVEFLNPGGPYGNVSPENFGQPGITDYRNPTIAEAMRALGYVQRFGVGLPLVRQFLARNNNPPAQFRVDSTHVAVTVTSRE